ncbi:MAG: gliding motility-associated C-terminal domain-containing protein [Bacteroidales bacterium]
MKFKIFLLLLDLFIFGSVYGQMTVTLSGQTNTVCNGFGCQYDGPSILINEVMIRPSSGDGSIYGSEPQTPLSQRQGEWIELYNPDLCKAVDISCYFLGNCSPEGSGFYGGGYELPAGTIVPPRGFVIVRGVNANPVPANLLVQNGGNTVECVITAGNSVCVGGGYRLWFPNAGGWYAFFDRDGVPQDAISWNDPANQALSGNPCNPVGNCPFTGTLDSYNDIPAARKNYIHNNQPSMGQTIRRIPDGGNWVVNSTAAPTYGNCNAACAPAPVVTCVGTATVSVTGGTPPYYYQWDDGLQQVTQTAVGLCGGTYCVTVTDNAGATAVGCIFVDNFTPDVFISSTDQHVCIDKPAFPLSGGNPAGGSYQGNGVSNGIFDPLIAGIGDHNITYTYFSEDSCSSSDSITITVHNPPTAFFPPLIDLCVNAAPYVLNTGFPSGGTYLGPGVVSNTFDPLLTGVGTFLLSYVYADSIGCDDTAYRNITVIDAPDVQFASISAICVDHAPILLSQGSPTGGTYSGPGVSGFTFDPALAGVGFHNLTYKFVAPTGCGDSAVQIIQVLPLPVVESPEIPGVCISGEPVILSGGTPSGGTYSGFAVSNGIFDPALAGTGVSALIYSYIDGNGCTNSDTSQLTVFQLPQVSQGAFPPFCINVPSVTLTGGLPAGGTYSGPGVISGGEFQASLTGMGTFSITYIYSDTNACIDSTHADLTVYDIPDVGLSPLNPVCKGIPAFPLTGGSPPGGTYSGVGVNNNNFNPVFASTYTITYSFMDNNGCVNDTVQLLDVLDKPVVTLAVFPDLCINSDPLALSGGTPIGGTYSGTGVIGTEFQPAAAGAGTFSINYSYANIAGCEDSAQQLITVHVLPVVNFSPEDGICIGGDSVLLSGGDPPGGIYSGPGVYNGVFDPDSTGVGTFTLNYIFIDQYNCTDSADQTITVHPLPYPFNVTGGGINCQDIGSPVSLDSSEVDVRYRLLLNGVIQGFPFFGTGDSFSFGNQYNTGVYTVYAVNISTGCENTMLDSAVVDLIPLPDPRLPDSLYLCEVSEIILDAGTYADSLSYLWQDGSTQRLFSVREPGIYWVKVGLGDCIATDSIEIFNCSKLIIPNVFTPNSDNFNDRFIPSPIGDIVNYKIDIYNRWGKLVYSSVDLEEGWDGTMLNQGSLCPDGTYFYIINYTSITYPNNYSENKASGSVTLLR